MKNDTNEEPADGSTAPDTELISGRHPGATSELSPEDQDKLRRSKRSLMLVTIVLGLAMLVLGVLAGQNLAKSRTERATGLDTGIVAMCDVKDVNAHVR